MYEIVIKLSDEEYEALQRASYYSFDKYTAYIAMKSGIVLPKGHGRMIDTDVLENKMLHSFVLPTNYGDRRGYRTRENECFTDIVNTPTIIEADEETDSDEY